MLSIQNTEQYVYCGNNPSETKYYGKIYYKDGSSYQGHFINKLKNGYGEQKNLESYYKGYWKDDKYHGCGTFFNYKDMSYMTGYYQEGLLEGECLFYDKNLMLVNKALYKNGKSCVPTYDIITDEKKNKIYEGFVFKDKYNGFGKLYENGRVYIGNFISGKKDGKFLVCNKDGHLIYSPDTTLEIMIDIDKVTNDNFINYKNTVLFVNDYFDDNHKIIYKEKLITKYVGKFNMDLKYEDDHGILFENNNRYSGKFVNGKFISGTLTTQEGEFKGEFENIMLNGKGTLINDKYSYFGNFVNNVCTNGDMLFKYNGINALIVCGMIYNTEHFILDIPNPASMIIKKTETDNETYIGNIKISCINKLDVKFNIIEGKHLQNNTLIYEGNFRNNQYHGSGIRYHSNGFIQASGKFENGEPSKCEYFDDTGNLIFSDENVYSDQNNTNDDYHDLPPLVAINNIPIETNTIINNTNTIPTIEDITVGNNEDDSDSDYGTEDDDEGID